MTQEVLDAELVMIADALAGPAQLRGGLSTAQLRRRIRGESWARGRFAAALREAVGTGLVQARRPDGYARSPTDTPETCLLGRSIRMIRPAHAGMHTGAEE